MSWSCYACAHSKWSCPFSLSTLDFMKFGVAANWSTSIADGGSNVAAREIKIRTHRRGAQTHRTCHQTGRRMRMRKAATLDHAEGTQVEDGTAARCHASGACAG